MFSTKQRHKLEIYHNLTTLFRFSSMVSFVRQIKPFSLGITSLIRSFSSNTARTALFQQAVAAMKAEPSPTSPTIDVSNESKLKLYALFKQSEIGDCTGVRPGIFDPVGRAKFDAWQAIAGTSKDQAMDLYVSNVTNIYNGKLPKVGATDSNQKSDFEVVAEGGKYSPRCLQDISFPGQRRVDHVPLETILFDHTSIDILRVGLNRPKKGNSFNLTMWEDLHETWQRIACHPTVKVVILSGSGSNFSTGMDLSVFVDFQRILSTIDCDGRKREAIGRFIDYLQTAISGPEACRVPVIAAIHGQCIGGAIDLICATDLRYCTKDAIFCVKETDLAIVSLTFCMLDCTNY
jgi:acyl-CoA-binding protein